jgi:hypothetical protein
MTMIGSHMRCYPRLQYTKNTSLLPPFVGFRDLASTLQRAAIPRRHNVPVMLKKLLAMAIFAQHMLWRCIEYLVTKK